MWDSNFGENPEKVLRQWRVKGIKPPIDRKKPVVFISFEFERSRGNEIQLRYLIYSITVRKKQGG